MRTIAAIILAAATLTMTGCATAGGALGKLQKADDALAAKYAGSYGTAALGTARKVLGVPDANDSRERIPAGYSLVWDSWLDGVKIDRARIQDVPRLVPAVGTTAVPVSPTGPEAPDDPPPAGQADDVTPPATNAPAGIGPLLKAIGSHAK